jgi:hypothetical protein
MSATENKVLHHSPRGNNPFIADSSSDTDIEIVRSGVTPLKIDRPTYNE